MSGGFGLPVLDIAGALGKLGKTYQDSYNAAKRETALSKLGEQIKAGDISGAANTALGAGDVSTGLNLLKYGQEQDRQKLNATAFGGLPSMYGGNFDANGPASAPSGPPSSGGGLPSFLDTNGPSGNYLTGLIKRESGGNPNAQASTSSAAGLTQFTDRTWRSVAAQHPELGLTPDGRTDPGQSIRAAQAFTNDNADLLRQSKLPVNDASLYSMHFLGAGGGRRFVAGTLANPDTPAASLVQPGQVAANRSIFFNRDGSPKTAGDVMGDFQRSFGGAARAPAQPPQQVASADPSFAPQMPTAPGTLNRPLQAPVAGMNLDAPSPTAAAPQQAAPAQVANALPPGLSGSEGRGPIGSVPGQGQGQPQGLPAAAQAPQHPMPTLGGASSGPVMTMPGTEGSTPSPQARSQVSSQAPQHLVQAGIPQQAAAPLAQMAPGSSQRVQYLIRLGGLPGLDEGQRSTVSTLLHNELQQTNLPDTVKEYVWARSRGMTQAKSPAEYALEKSPDQRQIVTAPDGRQYVVNKSDANTAPRSLDLPSPGIRVWGTPGADGQSVPLPPGMQSGTPGYYDEKGVPHVSLTPGTNQGDKSTAQVDKNLTDYIQTSYDKSQGAVGTLAAIDRQKRAIDAGLISGAGADWQTQARATVVKLLGLPEDAVTNSQVFDAASTQKSAELAKTISQAGHTTNMDLQLGKTIAGGDRTKTETALRAIVAAQEQLARDQITRHNTAITKYQHIRPDAAASAEFYRMDMPSVYEYGDAKKEIERQQSGRQQPPPSPRQPDTAQAAPPAGAPQGTRRAPDGKFYAPDPSRPGRYLEVR